MRFDGDPHARLRPMAPVLGALRTLGVEVDDDGRGGLPFTVHGRGSVRGGAVTLDASASSQFVSGLLLSGARFDEGVTVHHDGKAVPSLPHIEMTVETLRDAGVVVDDGDEHTWRVEPSEVNALDVQVEPDLSNAAQFLAAALVTDGRVQVPGWPQYTTQGGDFIRDVLDMMGAEVVLDRAGLTVSGGGRHLRHRRRPARLQRAHARSSRRCAPSPTPRASSAGSPTSAGTRPTGSRPCAPS